MAFQPVTNTAQFSFHHEGSGSLLGASALWSFYALFATAPTLANLTTIVDDLTAERGVHYMHHLAAAWTLTKIRGRSLHVEGGPSYERVNLGPGTRPGDAMPPNNAFIWRFRASSGGASSRGRVYLPIGVETDVSGNEWSAVLQGEIETNEQAWIQNALALVPGTSHVVVSRYSGTQLVQRTAPVRRANAITTAVASYDPVALVGSQRERRP